MGFSPPPGPRRSTPFRPELPRGRWELCGRDLLRAGPGRPVGRRRCDPPPALRMIDKPRPPCTDRWRCRGRSSPRGHFAEVVVDPRARPQSTQKLWWTGLALPQPGQGLSSRAPHAEQCLWSGEVSAPQDGQFIGSAGYSAWFRPLLIRMRFWETTERSSNGRGVRRPFDVVDGTSGRRAVTPLAAPTLRGRRWWPPLTGSRIDTDLPKWLRLTNWLTI